VRALDDRFFILDRSVDIKRFPTRKTCFTVSSHFKRGKEDFVVHVS
jgi:hypothetical protein